MKVAELDSYIGEEPIWKYKKANGVYVVRNRGKCSNGTNHFTIQSPTGKLYTFYEYYGTETDAISDIINMKAEGEEFFCSLSSIYEE